MLSALEARGLAASRIALARTRLRVAQVLREMLPGVSVTVEDGGIVLAGRFDVDDERLRWIGSLLP